MPDQEKLINALNQIASILDCKPMNREQADNFINHILYDLNWWGTSAKNGWEHYRTGLITEREICSLFLQHFKTKIAYFNKASETDLPSIYQEEIFKLVEMSLLGRSAVLLSAETKQSWDK